MAIISGVVVISALIFAVGFDVHSSNHNFENSFTGKKLKEYGGFEYGLMAYEQAALVSNKTAQWAIENVPVYWNSTSEYAKPYVKLARDVSIVAYNVSRRQLQGVFQFASDKYPVVQDWAQSNLPIVRDSIYSAAVTAKSTAGVAVESTKKYASDTADYLKTNVFVGKLSPESLQQMTKEAYDTTKDAASNTYSWFYEKVQTLSK